MPFLLRKRLHKWRATKRSGLFKVAHRRWQAAGSMRSKTAGSNALKRVQGSKFKVCPQEAAELRFKVPSSKFKNGHQAVYVIFDNLWKLTGISVKYKT